MSRSLADLERGSGAPTLPPLRIPDLVPSRRGGIVGRTATRVRRLTLRMVEPSLVELLTQLERDRHRQRAEIARLEARIAALEERARDE